MEKFGEAILQSLIKAAIALAILTGVLIALALFSEVYATGGTPSIITEVSSSPEPPAGWYPPLLL